MLKIVTQKTLEDINPLKECFIIKNTLDKKLCLEIVDFLNYFKRNLDENIRKNGENWYYLVRSNNNYFASYLFNELHRLKFEPLRFAFENLYNLLGENTEINSLIMK